MEKNKIDEMFEEGRDKLAQQYDDDDDYDYSHLEEAIDEVDDEDIEYNFGDDYDDEAEGKVENEKHYNPKTEPEFNHRYPTYNIETEGEEEDIPQLDPFDLPLFPNGPTKSEVEMWKRKWDGYGLRVIEIQEDYYIFRTLNRYEYKQVCNYNIDALAREEVICETCTLWPEAYNHKDMAIGKAGVPSTYAQIIMEESGFTKNYKISIL